jgi:hypothetical protein
MFEKRYRRHHSMHDDTELGRTMSQQHLEAVDKGDTLIYMCQSRYVSSRSDVCDSSGSSARWSSAGLGSEGHGCRFVSASGPGIADMRFPCPPTNEPPPASALQVLPSTTPPLIGGDRSSVFLCFSLLDITHRWAHLHLGRVNIYIFSLAASCVLIFLHS